MLHGNFQKSNKTVKLLVYALNLQTEKNQAKFKKISMPKTPCNCFVQLDSLLVPNLFAKTRKVGPKTFRNFDGILGVDSVSDERKFNSDEPDEFASYWRERQ